MSNPQVAVRFTRVVAVTATIIGLVTAVPAEMHPSLQTQSEDGGGGAGGFATVVWSVLDDCFGGDHGSATVCLKTRVLTALDRALAKPTVTVTDGLTLATRTGKSLADPQTDKADRAALDATNDPDQKNALLDDMLASRFDRLMTTRTVVLDSPADQEGRGKKKKMKGMQQAMMMAGMTAAAVMGPMALKIIALIAGKALLISKIALLLASITALKKLMSQQGGGQEEHHHGRSMRLDANVASTAQNMAYSGQNPQ